MTPSLLLLIPSHDRDGLLARTLESLAVAERPPQLRRVVVAENGGKLGAEALVAQFQSRLPVEYRYTDMGNKSRALNEALAEASEDWVVFHDDDVRLAPGSLAAYCDVLKDHPAGVFLGGRCGVDYESPPPEWLLQYLPTSAKGWSLGEDVRDFNTPEALGCNWAAASSDLKRLGGFSEERGPGTSSRGQERDMQARLLRAGVSGRYVPQAMVWHWVPRSRCSPEWVLNRAGQMGAYHGMEYVQRPWPRRIYTRWSLALQVWWQERRLKRLGSEVSLERRFAPELRVRWHQGALRAMKNG